MVRALDILLRVGELKKTLGRLRPAENDLLSQFVKYLINKSMNELIN